MKLFKAISVFGCLFFGGTPERVAFASDPTIGDPPDDSGVDKTAADTMEKNKQDHENLNKEEPNATLLTPTGDTSNPRLRRGGESGSSMMTKADKMAIGKKLDEEIFGGLEINELTFPEMINALKKAGSRLEDTVAHLESINVGEFTRFEAAKSLGEEAGKKAIKHVETIASFIEHAEQQRKSSSLVLHHEKLQGKQRRRRAQESPNDDKRERKGRGTQQDSNGEQTNHRRRFDPFTGSFETGGGRFSTSPRIPGHLSHLNKLMSSLLNGDLSGATKGATEAKRGHHIGHGSRRLHGRSLATKEEQCDVLVQCARGMSTTDLFVYMYGDDIDPANGKIDSHIIRFDEGDFFNKQRDIKDLLDFFADTWSESYDDDQDSNCDELLQQFHRSTEVKGAPKWRGAMVAEVCHAEGSTVQLQLAEIVRTLIGGFPLEDKDGYGDEFRDGCDRLAHGDLSSLSGTEDETFSSAAECQDHCSPDFYYACWLQGTRQCWCQQRHPDFVVNNNDICPAEGLSTYMNFYPTTNRLFQEMYDWFTNALSSKVDLILNEVIVEPFLCAGEIFDTLEYAMCGAGDDRCSNREQGDTRANAYDGYVARDDLHYVRCCSDSNIGNGFEERHCNGVWGESVCPGVFPNEIKEQVSFDEAKSTCANLGGRLCTVEEIQLGCGQGTGCGYDEELVWVLSKGGSAASPFRLEYVTCGEPGQCEANNDYDGYVDPGELHPVRCCSDNDIGNGFGGAFCKNDDTPNVWATSICTATEEPLLFTFEEAQEQCANIGGRLCTAEEIERSCTVGTGCQYNYKLLWATTDVTDLRGYRMPTGIDASNCGPSQARDCHGQLHGNDPSQEFVFTSVLGILAGLDNHACEEHFVDAWDECVKESDSQLIGRFEDFTTNCLFPRYQEAFADCYAEAFSEFDTALKLIFGGDVTAGYICGIRNAVVEEGLSLPGSCCLDAPYQLDGEFWGSQYDCSQPCQHPGPVYAGLSEEGCSAHGGIWCPAPADCTVLQTCIAHMNTTAIAEDLPAFQAYLALAPAINDPMNQNQCAQAREYFGYNEYFINDQQICDDVLQLRLARTFDWLENFFNQGDKHSPDTGTDLDGIDVDVTGCGEPEESEGVTFETVELPGDTFKEPSTEYSGAEAVGNGAAWASTNFVFEQIVTIARSAFDAVEGVDCGGSFVAVACALVKNAASLPLLIVLIIAEQTFAISAFSFGQVAEWSNVQQFEIYEHVLVMKENMQKNAEWMRDSLNTLVTNQENMFNTNKDNIDKHVASLATRNGENTLLGVVGSFATLAGQNTIKRIVEEIQVTVNTIAGTGSNRRALLTDGKEINEEAKSTNDADRITLIIQEEVARALEANANAAAATLEDVKNTIKEEVKTTIAEELRAEFQGHMGEMIKELRTLFQENTERHP